MCTQMRFLCHLLVYYCHLFKTMNELSVHKVSPVCTYFSNVQNIPTKQHPSSSFMFEFTKLSQLLLLFLVDFDGISLNYTWVNTSTFYPFGYNRSEQNNVCFFARCPLSACFYTLKPLVKLIHYVILQIINLSSKTLDKILPLTDAQNN